MLGILHWLSIWDIPITLLLLLLLLLVFLLLLLFTDQELLRGPAKLPTLHLSLRGLYHNGWQPVLQLTAALKVWGVREYLQGNKTRAESAVESHEASLVIELKCCIMINLYALKRHCAKAALGCLQTVIQHHMTRLVGRLYKSIIIVWKTNSTQGNKKYMFLRSGTCYGKLQTRNEVVNLLWGIYE